MECFGIFPIRLILPMVQWDGMSCAWHVCILPVPVKLYGDRNAFECLLAMWARLRCRQCPRVMSETHSVQGAYVCSDTHLKYLNSLCFSARS